MPRSIFTDAYAALLSTLVETRKQANVSQAELARRVGRPQPFISYIERGERRLDVIEFYALMKALDVDPVDVFATLTRSLPAKLEI